MEMLIYVRSIPTSYKFYTFKKYFCVFLYESNERGSLVKVKWNIKGKLIFITSLLFIVPMIILGIISYYYAKNELDKRGQEILENSVKMVISMIEQKNKEVERGIISLEEAQEEIKEYMLGKKRKDGTRTMDNNVNLGKNGYFIIYSQDGLEIAHPRIEGQNIWNTEDYSGTGYFFVRDVIKVANRGGGFTYYDWVFPNSDKIGTKINYSEIDTNWNWVVNATAYVEDFNSGAKNILYVLIITVTLEVIMGFTIIVFVARKMSEPIEKLADQAIKISNGELEMNDIEVEGNDEIAYLTMAFNQMIHDIKKLIKEIKDKAALKALLKETELKALQSQVNPHFLFNILSVITESALIEGADKTLSMVEKISGMLRYSLTSFHKEVKLEDELEMVKRYVYLQSQRFGDRIKFEIDLPENIPLIYMTCMTIQPIVENAIIHGLERKVEGGTIKISLKEEEKNIIIQIQDDGIGIEKEVLDKLFNENNQKNHTGHTTGIGIKNVYERLKIYFEQENLLLIDSEINVGTCITILLPRINKRGGK